MGSRLCSQITHYSFQFDHSFSTTANNISASCCAAIDKLILKLIERQKAVRAKAILEKKQPKEWHYMTLRFTIKLQSSRLSGIGKGRGKQINSTEGSPKHKTHTNAISWSSTGAKVVHQRMRAVPSKGAAETGNHTWRRKEAWRQGGSGQGWAGRRERRKCGEPRKPWMNE